DGQKTGDGEDGDRPLGRGRAGACLDDAGRRACHQAAAPSDDRGSSEDPPSKSCRKPNAGPGMPCGGAVLTIARRPRSSLDRISSACACVRSPAETSSSKCFLASPTIALTRPSTLLPFDLAMSARL